MVIILLIFVCILLIFTYYTASKYYWVDESFSDRLKLVHDILQYIYDHKYTIKQYNVCIAYIDLYFKRIKKTNLNNILDDILELEITNQYNGEI